MNAVTLNHARKNLDHLIEQVVSNTEPTIVSTDAGHSVVILSLDEYNSWQETLYLLSNPANAEHLRASIQAEKEGRLIELDISEL